MCKWSVRSFWELTSFRITLISDDGRRKCSEEAREMRICGTSVSEGSSVPPLVHIRYYDNDHSQLVTAMV